MIQVNDFIFDIKEENIKSEYRYSPKIYSINFKLPIDPNNIEKLQEWKANNGTNLLTVPWKSSQQLFIKCSVIQIRIKNGLFDITFRGEKKC